MMIVQTQKLRALLQFEVVARKKQENDRVPHSMGWQRVVLGPFRGGGPDFKLAEGRA